MKKVLLIDSGSGGINVLKECVKVAPYCDFLMFCDDKNMPYGNKTKEELLNITFDNLDMISSFFKFEIVVFACNTLTSVCIFECRKKYPNIVFIGTEPAVKPALKKFEEKEILLLATENTLKYNNLTNACKNLEKIEMKSLAKDIDDNLDDLNVLKSEIESVLVGRNEKAVVLGCTHYSVLSDMIKHILPDVSIFDGAAGVAKRLLSFVKNEVEEYQVQIMVTKSPEFLSKLWWYYKN